MSKSAFAKAIIGKLSGAIGTDGSAYSSGSASSAMSAVAAAITEYLIANVTVTISYKGIIPGSPPQPDPTVTDTFKIVGVCAPLSPSNSFNGWIKELETKIISGFSLAPMGTAGVVFSQKPFLNTGITTIQSDLTSAHDIRDTSPQQKIWEIVCDGIMDWINETAINTVPGTASHPTAGSTGTAFITRISIS